MRWVSIVTIVTACAACQPTSEDQQIATLPDHHPQSNTQPPNTQPQLACRDFTAPVTAGGKPEQASGQACEEPGGSLRVVQNTPGLPVQSYEMSPAGQSPVTASPAFQPQPNLPACSSYTAQVSVGGQPRQAVIEACPQPDGSWKITQNTPGLPEQTYEVPPPASSPYPYGSPYPANYAYPEFFPYWVGAPWFFGLGPSVVVINRFNHFHHGFAPGFARGFGRGFSHGFGHGFAAARAGGGGRH